VAPVAAEASEEVTNEQASTDDTWVALVGVGDAFSEDEPDVELDDPPHAAATKHAMTSVALPIQRRASRTD